MTGWSMNRIPEALELWQVLLAGLDLLVRMEGLISSRLRICNANASVGLCALLQHDPHK